MKNIIVLFTIFLLINECRAQEYFESEEEFKKQYELNIKKTRLDGVYIPADLEEAFEELQNLSTPEDIQKFKNGPENIVARKLHFGLGRWMAVNWKFYSGSRLSHLLKGKGLLSPDHMSQFMIIAFHRKLNNIPLEEDELILLLKEKRMDELSDQISRTKLLKEETRPIPKDGNN